MPTPPSSALLIPRRGGPVPSRSAPVGCWPTRFLLRPPLSLVETTWHQRWLAPYVAWLIHDSARPPFARTCTQSLPLAPSCALYPFVLDSPTEMRTPFVASGQEDAVIASCRTTSRTFEGRVTLFGEGSVMGDLVSQASLRVPVELACRIRCVLPSVVEDKRARTS
jgi:hypothetical protein